MGEQTEVIVGVIGKPHGVRGEVMVEPRTDEPERRFTVGQRLRVEDSPRSYVLSTARWHGDRLVVRFEGIENRDQAEAARGQVLVVDVAVDEVPADPEEFYDRHLIGLRVLTHDGRDAGTVIAVQHLPTQDLLVVQTPGGQRYVPFTTALVPQVDLSRGTCTVADVSGLIDDDAEEAR